MWSHNEGQRDYIHYTVWTQTCTIRVFFFTQESATAVYTVITVKPMLAVLERAQIQKCSFCACITAHRCTWRQKGRHTFPFTAFIWRPPGIFFFPTALISQLRKGDISAYLPQSTLVNEQDLYGIKNPGIIPQWSASSKPWMWKGDQKENLLRLLKSIL